MLVDDHSTTPLMPKAVQDTIRALPKIELHRHLEGSVRLETLVDIARDHHLDVVQPLTADTLRPLVQVVSDETHSPQQFLSKFAVLRQFYLTEAIVQRITREIVADAAADNVRYMELRFTPRALCHVTRSPLEDVVRLVCDTANEAASAHNMMVRYIVSMNRHEGVELGEQVLRAALNNRSRGVVGLDLAGDEANFSCLPFRGVFKRAKAAGLGTTIHAGEWSGADSVWDAVGNLGADRVGHGIRVIHDEAMSYMLSERGVTLEVCPSSNFYSGIVPALGSHPLPGLLARGVRMTLNTDDPAVCNITLSDELMRTMAHMHISFGQIKQMMLHAAQATFLPDDERAALIRAFEGHMAAAHMPSSFS